MKPEQRKKIAEEKIDQTEIGEAQANGTQKGAKFVTADGTGSGFAPPLAATDYPAESDPSTQATNPASVHLNDMAGHISGKATADASVSSGAMDNAVNDAENHSGAVIVWSGYWP